MRYLTLFLEAENIHLVKDVGMIPYTLHQHHQYKSTLACYRNGSYNYAQTDVQGLELVFVKRISGNAFIDGLLFLMANARKYDLLQVYHLSLYSLLWLNVFKVIKGNATTYLKLDANEKILDYPQAGIKGWIIKFLLRKVTIVSVEVGFLKIELSRIWGRNIELIPNGYLPEKNGLIPYTDKKNMIITVGRIGSPEKKHEFLLAAFASFCHHLPNWQLVFVGPIEPDFKQQADLFFNANPQLNGKITFTGAIQDRATLQEYYKMAKIFCLTSEREGFPLALIEAAGAGCYLITSDIIAADDITNNGQFGSIFPVGDVEKLTTQLIAAASNETLLHNNCTAVQQFALQTFTWQHIMGKLNLLLQKQY